MRKGLSPRVRGKQVLDVGGQEPQGSIPACAGETNRSSLSATRDAVYPRVCGGNCSNVPAALAVIGLSPRVRGKLAFLLYVFPTNGSIPACAGETTVVIKISFT